MSAMPSKTAGVPVDMLWEAARPGVPPRPSTNAGHILTQWVVRLAWAAIRVLVRLAWAIVLYIAAVFLPPVSLLACGKILQAAVIGTFWVLGLAWSTMAAPGPLLIGLVLIGLCVVHALVMVKVHLGDLQFGRIGWGRHRRSEFCEQLKQDPSPAAQSAIRLIDELTFIAREPIYARLGGIPFAALILSLLPAIVVLDEVLRTAPIAKLPTHAVAVVAKIRERADQLGVLDDVQKTRFTELPNKLVALARATPIAELPGAVAKALGELRPGDCGRQVLACLRAALPEGVQTQLDAWQDREKSGYILDAALGLWLLAVIGTLLGLAWSVRNKYEFRNGRVRVTRGLLVKRDRIVELFSVTTIEVRRSLCDAITGKGTLLLSTGSRSETRLPGGLIVRHRGEIIEMRGIASGRRLIKLSDRLRELVLLLRSIPWIQGMV